MDTGLGLLVPRVRVRVRVRVKVRVDIRIRIRIRIRVSVHFKKHIQAVTAPYNAYGAIDINIPVWPPPTMPFCPRYALA